MKRDALKYVQFALIVLLGIAADQWTKTVASDRLAGQSAHPTRGYNHPMRLTVPQRFDGKPLKDLLAHELTRNTPEEQARIGKYFTYNKDARRLYPGAKLKAGEVIEIRRRKIVIIKDYFDFEYAENPGAAFSFLADANSSVRKPFFITVSIIALLTILYILYGVAFTQQLAVLGLSFIAAGAIGNFIDRLTLGYVIDFIVWKYTEQHRWPTFNIADVWIVAGVGFMLLELGREMLEERRLAKTQAENPDDDPSLAEATPA